jgi:hypothetical protein
VEWVIGVAQAFDTTGPAVAAATWFAWTGLHVSMWYLGRKTALQRLLADEASVPK